MRHLDSYPEPSTGLRSDDLLAHLRATPVHLSVLTDQLTSNGYDADRVSHDWLSDVHTVAHTCIHCGSTDLQQSADMIPWCVTCDRPAFDRSDHGPHGEVTCEHCG